MLKALFGSKKFMAALASALAVLINELTGAHISEDALLAMLSPMLAYIVGQGIADHGKEKAKIDKTIAEESSA